MEGTTMSDMRRMMMMFIRPVESGSDTVPNPTISPSAGAIFPTQTISISISGIATSAEYSFDNQTWTTYSSPFTLSSATTVYARATDGSGNYSSVTSNSYTLLPYDAEVEYLETTGTQWVQTNINTDGRGIEAQVTAQHLGGTAEQALIGRTNSGGYELYYSSNKIGMYNNSSAHVTTSIDKNTHSIVGTVTNNTTKLSIDGVEYTKSATATSGGGGNNAYISFFKHNTKYYFVGRMMQCKILKNGVLAGDFIPVRVGQTGYLYDKVSGNLFGNSGSGSFTYGNDVTT